MDFLTTLNGVKNAYDLCKNAYDSTKDAKLQKAVTDCLSQLNEVLFQLGNLQRLTMELEAENDRLKQKNLQIQNWEKEKDYYVLKKLADGVFVYAPKHNGAAGDDGVSDDYYLCPNCYHQGRKSILQFKSLGFDGTHFLCHSCQAEIIDREKKDSITCVSVESPRRRSIFEGY